MQPLIIFSGLILLLFLIGLALAIHFFVIPSYKASELFECLFHFPEVLIDAVSTFYCVHITLQAESVGRTGVGEAKHLI